MKKSEITAVVALNLKPFAPLIFQTVCCYQKFGLFATKISNSTYLILSTLTQAIKLRMTRISWQVRLLVSPVSIVVES